MLAAVAIIAAIPGFSATAATSAAAWTTEASRARMTIRTRGVLVPPVMGTAIALKLSTTRNGRAAINGNFVMLAEEVNPVIAALKEERD